MADKWQSEDLHGVLEAMLFVTDEPVNVMTLADVLEITPGEVQAGLEELRVQLEEGDRGIQLREVAGGWRLSTHPRYHEVIENYVLSWDTHRLSQAALESLAIIAYLQPITRNGVSSVRGVNSDSSINSLLSKRLIRETGTQDTPGNPILYGTSKAFLERFGLRSLDDLPELESFAPDEETREFIASRLNVAQPEYRVIEPVEEESPLEAGSIGEAMQSMVAQALASSAGVVDKINFDELVFEEDDLVLGDADMDLKPSASENPEGEAE